MADLAHRFQYHPPTTQAAREAHELIRQTLSEAAHTIIAALPEGSGREQALFLTNIEQAMFWGNAAVARHAGSEGGTANPAEDDKGAAADGTA